MIGAERAGRSGLPAEVSALYDRPGPDPVRVLTELDPTAFDRDALVELTALFEQQQAWLAGRQARVLAELGRQDGDGDWGREELRLAAGLGPAAVVTRLHTAAELDRLPLLAAALEAGQISWQHADACAQATHRLDPAAAAQVAEGLLGDPRLLTAGQWRFAARSAAAALQPAEHAARAAQIRADRRLELFDTAEGSTCLIANLPHLEGQLVRTAIRALGRRMDAADERSAPQRRADALVELCAGYLNAGRLPEDGGIRPHLIVHVPFGRVYGPSRGAGTGARGGCDAQRRPGGSGGAAGRDGPVGPDQSVGPDGRAGPGWALGADGRAGPVGPAILNGAPLTAAELAMLACDCQLTRLITDPRTGLPEDLGRTTRVISSGLRGYLLARDRHCRFPGCTVERNLHAHHIKHWEDGGPTDKANLLLTCRRHHHAIHDAGWTVTLTGAHASWISPNGTAHPSPAPGAML